MSINNNTLLAPIIYLHFPYILYYNLYYVLYNNFKGGINLKRYLNRNVLKYIAIVAMFLDHIAMFFVSKTDSSLLYSVLRFAGRLTAPIMCFFIAEGFYYTHSRKKYGERLALFAVISQFAYTLAHHKTLLTSNLFTDWNVIFTLFIGFLVLVCYEKISNPILKWTSIVLLIMLSSMGDWGIIAPVFVLVFYAFRDNIQAKLICFSLASGAEVLSDVAFMISKHRPWYGEIWQAGIFLIIPLQIMYNGQKGSSSQFNKWFFYIFYPLHLLIFGLIEIYA